MIKYKGDSCITLEKTELGRLVDGKIKRCKSKKV